MLLMGSLLSNRFFLAFIAFKVGCLLLSLDKLLPLGVTLTSNAALVNWIASRLLCQHRTRFSCAANLDDCESAVGLLALLLTRRL
jgi:hypothetical protein